MKGRKGDWQYKITAVFLAAALLVGSGAGMPVTVQAQENSEIQEPAAAEETETGAEGAAAHTLSENDGEASVKEEPEASTEAERKFHSVFWTIYVEGNYRYYPFEAYPTQVTAVNLVSGETQTGEVEDQVISSGWCMYSFRLENGSYAFYADGEQIAEKTIDDGLDDIVEIEPSWIYYGVWFCDENGERPLEMCYVKSGQTASVNEPGRPGYVFDGWVKTPGGADKFDLSTPITESIKLYASWKEASDSTITGSGWSITKDGTLTIQSNQGFEDWAANGRIKYKQRVTRAKIDASVTKLPDSAFEDCIQMAEVEMSEKAAEWGDNVFNCCESLSTVEIPSGVTRIGDGAFFLCKAMKSITIPECVEQIDTYSFASSGLTSVRIPSRITKIPEGAFADCPDLQSVDIAGAVTEIGEYAFGRSGLRSIRIPASVKTIGTSVFYRCEQLAEANLSEGLTEIGDTAFAKSGLRSIEIPDSVVITGIGAFEECRNLTKVKLSENLENVGYALFRKCGIKTITIPKNLESMAVFMFKDCAALEKVVMKPETPPFMLYAFVECNKMKKGSIIVPKGTAETYKAHSGWITYKELIVEETASGSGGNGGQEQGDQTQGNQGADRENSDRDGSGNGSQSGGGQNGNDGQDRNGNNDLTASAGKTDGRSSGAVGKTGGKTKIAAVKGDGAGKSDADHDGAENGGDGEAVRNSDGGADVEQNRDAEGMAEGTGTEKDGSLARADNENAQTFLSDAAPDGLADEKPEEKDYAALVWCGVTALLFLLLVLLLYLADRRYGIIAKIKKNGRQNGQE